MSKIKTVAAYLTGYAQTKNAVREVKISANLPINFLRGLWVRVQEIRREAEEANALAKQDDKGLWDEMCRQHEITTQSVRLKYKVALFTNLILVLGIGLIVGNLLSNIDAGAMIIFANVVFLNLVLMILFQNAYRLNMAYTQSAPAVTQFLKDTLKNPTLLIGRTLPMDYKVRLELSNE
ncbi:TPA: hypothetical protein ACNIGT_000945 [Pseudomonas aeruginosa]|uniref:hypothetical protein n=1 Tax=Pseudomonas TaxID=286 RepID=UPI000F522322|nr:MULTISPECIES: hypothetical protein [Pseudomonas]EKV8707080.1 hypothetical protein [Pseudomonas aeruginosa]MBG5740375.1 hypothetical protein [Pseudomonas aeruginosa]MBG5887703.1 hypothetical protein [Pseudomonas aeruginosa]RQH65274.1 hypothetical protein IPC102_15545 [Pseudomonas aeruginosa]HBN8456771.1 hypothetical protein [Pseudomonas aeruginosa]